MSRYLPGIVALAVVVTTGIVHGIQSARWGSGANLAAAAARLEDIPAVIGDWDSEVQTIPKDQLEMAGAVNYLGRAYTNRVTRKSVNIVILCGRHGPMATHPPTVCFEGAGWKLTEDVKKRKIKDLEEIGSAEFWQGEFAKEVPGQVVRIRTLWSWGTSGSWVAADYPRHDFAGSEHLYKIYVTINATDRDDPSFVDPSPDFLKLFLPLLKSKLSPTRA